MPGEPDDKPRVYSGEKVRQGEIILRTRTRRLIFIGGLVGIVLVVLLVRVFAG